MIKLNDILNEKIDGSKVICDKCHWSWDISDGGNHPYTCHKCGHVNKEQEVDERSRSFAFTRKKRKFSKTIKQKYSQKCG